MIRLSMIGPMVASLGSRPIPPLPSSALGNFTIDIHDSYKNVTMDIHDSYNDFIANSYNTKSSALENVTIDNHDSHDIFIASSNKTKTSQYIITKSKI